MADISLLLVCIWALVGNAWHVLLLASRKGSARPPTISGHAAENMSKLWIHRFVHSMPLVVFLPAILGFLIPNGYIFASFLLLSGAVFDSIETFTLNKSTASISSGVNAHFVTAWLMAFSYFSYSLVISEIAGLSRLLYGPILMACVVLVIFANKGISKNVSLSMQMTYFMLVSLVAITAHLTIIWQ